MSQPHFKAPSPRRAGGRIWLRLLVTLIALAVLAAGAWQAYQWLVSDVERRRAVAEHGGSAPPPAADTDAAAAPPPAARGASTPQLSLAATGEPVAPAVIGGAVNRCVRGGQVIFTAAKCPEGSAAAADAAGANASGGLAAQAAIGAAGDEASQQQAECNFLSAELDRLGYEFRQPLPPPVLDQISTRLTALRAQSERAKCAPSAQAAASAASAAAPAHRRARASE